LAAAIGPFAGKETGETALLRRLLSFFRKGDVLVADRCFCAYWLVATLMKMGVEVCFRQVEGRAVSMFQQRRLGRNDHLIWKATAGGGFPGGRQNDALRTVYNFAAVFEKTKVPFGSCLCCSCCQFLSFHCHQTCFLRDLPGNGFPHSS
jgi:hypothetical protein